MSDPLGNRPWPEPPFDFGQYRRPPALQLPDGARTAVVIYLNMEYFRYDLPSPMALTPGQADRLPDVINYAWRDYGTRAGVWRVIDVLAKHGVKATVTLNSEVASAYPAVVDEFLDQDYEIANHGVTNSVHIYGQTPEHQKAIIAESTEAIEKATGTRPVGWLSPGLSQAYDSLDHLAEAGYRWVGEWGMNSDIPYRLGVGELIAVPYPQETNDLPLFVRYGRTSEEGYRQWVDYFDVLYEESETASKVMPISLHPYIIGYPHRIKVLDRVLEHIAAQPGVWFATAREVDEWYRAQERA
jgi:peptidoglycan/xylan/chitin deacetylase (PgdA/CDA1 family)